MQRRDKPGGKSRGSKTANSILYMDLKEILRENALRYLPAKTLYRSLTVCKDWKLQISSPFFNHNQSVCCRSLSGFFVQTPGRPPAFLSLDQMAYGVPNQELKFLPEPVDVKASANGLLCCMGCGSEKAYYVCNPVNQQWKQLPKPSSDHGSDPALALVFEPSLLNFVADYKVVCAFASNDIEGAYEFEIYSSLQNSWKVSAEMYFAHQGCRSPSFKLGRAIYMDGVVHWPTYNKILSLDMKTEKAAEIPNYGYGYDYGGNDSSSLGTMDGKLCIASIKQRTIHVNVIRNKHSNTMSTGATYRAASMGTYSSALTPEDIKLMGDDLPKLLLAWDGVLVLQVGTRFFWRDVKTLETKAFVQGETKCQAPVVVTPYVNSLVSLV